MKELLGICKEYHIALRCELKRKELREDDVARAAELAAYFTHCQLQPVHTALSLRSAMSIFFKLKNFGTCAHFCRRLLELNPGQKVGMPAAVGHHGDDDGGAACRWCSMQMVLATGPWHCMFCMVCAACCLQLSWPAAVHCCAQVLPTTRAVSRRKCQPGRCPWQSPCQMPS